MAARPPHSDEQTPGADELDFSTVMAGSVHDMKNALTLLLTTLDGVIEQYDAGQRPSRDSIVKVQHEGRRVNYNLIQLLTLYRIDKSQYYPNVEEHAVAEFLDEVVLEQQDVAAMKGLAVTVEADPDLAWFFDRELITGVLNNIIHNAYRYARTRLRLTAALDEDRLAITVEDDGPGFPEVILSSLADGQRPVSFKTGSTGLGLYFADVVARLHHNQGRRGSIALANAAPEGGGRFTLYLP